MKMCISAIFIFLLVLCSSSAQSRTWYIQLDGTGDAPTIQAGIDSAALGDTVLVAAGVYTWTNQGAVGDFLIIALDKQICLRSLEGAETTILDAEWQGRVVGISTNGATRLEGFTITRGWADEMSGGGVGAGIVCSYADPEIVGNIISNNDAMGRGGGMYCAYSEATITGNSIIGNTAYLSCGGIYCFYAGPDIVDNRFEHNSESGSGVYCLYSDPTIMWNVFSGITGEYRSQLMCLGSSPTIVNNTIVGNSTPSRGLIECYQSSSPIIAKNIIAGSLGGPALHCDSTSVPSVTCNNLWNNAGGNGDCALEADNFSTDPLFCDEAGGDYHLHENSPCAPDNSPSGCGLVGAMPVGCWGVPLGPGATALITIALGAVGAWRIARSRSKH
jgi:hypothetical protein